jgi:hypothetical protein
LGGAEHRRPWRPEGRAQARRSARASATSAGGRADPPGQGARGHGRECPRINCAGEAAKPLPHQGGPARAEPGRAGKPGMIGP